MGNVKERPREFRSPSIDSNAYRATAQHKKESTNLDIVVERVQGRPERAKKASTLAAESCRKNVQSTTSEKLKSSPKRVHATTARGRFWDEQISNGGAGSLRTSK